MKQEQMNKIDLGFENWKSNNNMLWNNILRLSKKELQNLIYLLLWNVKSSRFTFKEIQELINKSKRRII